MGRTLGFRRVIAAVLVVGATGAGLVVGGAGSAGGQGTPRPEPNCEVPGSPTDPIAAQVPTACATLRVTKVVHGTASPGTTFTVLVECSSTDPDRTRAQQLPPGQIPPFTTALTFPAGGGTQDVFIAGLSSCTVSEAPPGPGCALAGVTPPTTQITAPQVYPVFVTNTCASAPAVSQATIVVDPIVATPRFTG